MAEPRRITIDYGEFEIEIIIRPKVRKVLVERERRPRLEAEEKPRPVAGPARLAVILDQMLRMGSTLEPRVPEGTVIYEAVGVGLEKEVRVSDRLVRVPARSDYDLCELACELAERYDKVLFFTGDKTLVNDVRVLASERGLENIEVHYLPPSETAARAQLIEQLLKRIRSAHQSQMSQASSEPRKANKQNCCLLYTSPSPRDRG